MSDLQVGLRWLVGFADVPVGNGADVTQPLGFAVEGIDDIRTTLALAWLDATLRAEADDLREARGCGHGPRECAPCVAQRRCGGGGVVWRGGFVPAIDCRRLRMPDPVGGSIAWNRPRPAWRTSPPEAVELCTLDRASGRSPALEQ